MNKINKCFFFLLLLLLTGCFPWDDGAESEIVGHYYVRGNSRLENVYLGYEDSQYGGIGLINEPVTAVGNNENYIIAKRDGTEGESYYLLKVIRNGIHGDADKAILGPLERSEFDEKLKELGLSNSIKFDKEFKKNKSK